MKDGLKMIEITLEFKVDNENEMRGKVKAFLDALHEFCDESVVVMATDESESIEMMDIGYRYDDGRSINDALRRLCEKVGVDDWREIEIPLKEKQFRRLASFPGVRELFATTTQISGKTFTRDIISPKLRSAGIRTLGELTQYSKENILSIRNMGSKSVDLICERLGELGLSLVEE